MARLRVHRLPGEHMAPGCTMGRRQASRGSVMLWAVLLGNLGTHTTYLSNVADHVETRTSSRGRTGTVSLSPSRSLFLITPHHCPDIYRQAQDEVYKSGLVQTHRETDRKKSQEERDETSDGDQYVFWVKCRKSDSSKWRRLSDGVDPSVLPGDWTCKNNTDTAFSSCSAPEEKSSMPEEEMFFYSLVPGSLVWARQSGYT
ncbi:hypothetical protein QTP70_023136, partial [Hemibagrus guttatus]